MQRPSKAPQTPPPTARLLVNVYNLSGEKLITFSQNVSLEGQNKWEELSIGLTAKEAVQVEISCENASNISVFFDDLSVKVQAVPTVIVVQENHYYPFGLGMKGLDWTLTPTKENKYQYNDGTEKNTDFDLGWYETEYRNLDTQINRFVQVDPKSEAGGQESLTTYQYAFNNPIRYNDPKGDCPPGVNCGDWLLGAVAALVDNAMGGITPVRSIVGQHISDKSGASFNQGQDVGDVASVVLGGFATIGGGAGGAAFAPVTFGGSVAVGVAVARAGVTTAIAGTINLTSQKGRVNAKQVPNPNGKKGGKEHQDKIEEVINDMKSRDLNVGTEHRVDTPDGSKSKRFVDVVGRDGTGKIVEATQVGKQNKNGTPVSREVKAEKDINETGKLPIINFVPYN